MKSFTFEEITREELINNAIEKMIDGKSGLAALFEVSAVADVDICNENYCAGELAEVLINDIIKAFFAKTTDIKETSKVYINLKNGIDNIDTPKLNFDDFATAEEYLEALDKVEMVPEVSKEYALCQISEILGLTQDDINNYLELSEKAFLERVLELRKTNIARAIKLVSQENGMGLREAKDYVARL